NQAGGRVGMIQVRLYRPFDAAALLQAIPLSVRRVAVLDRTKEPGALGEPLFADLVLALAQSGRPMPLVIGGRYGLSSKEFTPAMVQAVFRELDRPEPMPRFTVGIDDDVSRLSLTVGPEETEHPDVFRAVFYGLGADGTVGANKNTIKILGESPEIFAQGYFVYDSKKSGSTTVSHVRFGPKPIEAPYLIKQAQFVGVHQFGFVQKMDVLSVAAPGGVVLLSSPHGPEATWSRLPQTVRDQIRRKGLRLFVIDAHRVAREARLAGRTNMVMLTCFFAISGVLPREQAVERIKAFAAKTYARKGAEVVAKNHEAIDATLAALAEVAIPERDSQKGEPMILPLAPGAPTELQRLLGAMIAGEGDSLPVSALPPDGVFPSGTSRWEKRNIAEEIPIWDEASCIQCGRCTFVCPHAAVRPKLFHQSHLGRAPEGVRSAPIDARGFPETRFLLQIFGEDCTGCGLCVQTCPVRNEDGTRALNMAEKEPGLAACQGSQAFFDSLPVNDRASVDFSTVRGAQFLEPTFEFSGACAGCGETPYLRLVSQLFGDRMLVANATGCSSIFGGNLPTTPWSKNHEGRGPAWANSLFEDNAEFGLGMRLAADRHLTEAQALLVDLKDSLGAELVEEILAAPQALESDIRRQRERVARLVSRLQVMDRPDARRLLSIADHLTRRSVWIVGGDGWAYDIGSGGLDHVLAGGRDVNILVLDTEVYSNTGGQASKSTPLGAVARFAHAGKQVNKKDLALQAVSYGNVYVARIALGADPQQTLQALREAEAYPGTSLVIAYSPCIAHGIDMVESLDQQQRAVASGYWPLMRFNPVLREQGRAAFLLDSARPTIGFRDYADRELRYRLLHHTNPSQADELMEMAALAVKKRWRVYEQMAGVE
ncbi:MAG: pyruvate:ferredoxin (flavodoxin) oxidoreductase, partial [Fimbriimonadaceae bacterium]|nr:pyruvate:ferredoxin (flavodoxin) oxidoreductase [Fimbriimonadaceae bacterium]